MTGSASCVLVPCRALHDVAPVLRAVAALAEHGDVRGVQIALRAIDIDAYDRYWNDCGHEGLHRHQTKHTPGESRLPGLTSLGPSSFSSELEIAGAAATAASGWLTRASSRRSPRSCLRSSSTARTSGRLGVADLSIVRRLPDHVVPVSAGGLHALDNLVTSCGACNYQAKRTAHSKSSHFPNRLTLGSTTPGTALLVRPPCLVSLGAITGPESRQPHPDADRVSRNAPTSVGVVLNDPAWLPDVVTVRGVRAAVQRSVAVPAFGRRR